MLKNKSQILYFTTAYLPAFSLSIDIKRIVNIMAIAKENPDINKQIPTVLKCPPILFSKNFNTTLIFFPINLQFRKDKNLSFSFTQSSYISVINAMQSRKTPNPSISPVKNVKYFSLLFTIAFLIPEPVSEFASVCADIIALITGPLTVADVFKSLLVLVEYLVPILLASHSCKS